ncbi:hypothetical protein NMG60_11030771 [Bertholletia excelsa]
MQVDYVTAGKSSVGSSPTRENPFTPKAFVARYWTKRVSNNLPRPTFLLSKASPLSAADSASFTNLAGQNLLSEHLALFCAAANLLCFPDSSQQREAQLSGSGDGSFATYSNKSFANYGEGRIAGANAFKNYSEGDSGTNESFKRYSRGSKNSADTFDSYDHEVVVPDETFNSYGDAAGGGSGEFKNYQNGVNLLLRLNFTSYSSDGEGRKQSFKTYTQEVNDGQFESFSSYGKRGQSSGNDFSSYGERSNTIVSRFQSYGDGGKSANDTFTSYGFGTNVPENYFKKYGEGGEGGIDSFASYESQTNVGGSEFKSYAKNSNSEKVNFANYGNTSNGGQDIFIRYSDDAKNPQVGFKQYGKNTETFKSYAKKGVTFAEYNNETTSATTSSSLMAASGRIVNRWVEPGKFFREKMLRTGTVMPVPDIRDKMPKRSFLPRSISSKLPFSTARLAELTRIFHASENSSMARVLADALGECERAPSPGETKRCIGSVEDMIDFAISVLGRNVVVRTTRNTNGSGKDVMIGSVKGINGGRVTQSVSCHQSLYPYLLYYCHSVPKVRVYEADLMDPQTRATINHGVALCHIDTSAWSPTHGAFLALGSGPGKIEVCHWIFENDMTWAGAD